MGILCYDELMRYASIDHVYYVLWVTILGVILNLSPPIFFAQSLDSTLLPYLDIRKTSIEGPTHHQADTQFKQAITLHNTAYLTNNLDVAIQSKLILERFNQQKKSPLYPYALAYLGSVNAIIGKLSPNPIEKLAHTTDGLKKLKQANQSYRTVSVIIPILQANVCLSVPSFFKALADAESATAYLLSVVNESTLPPDIMAEIYRLHGDVLHRNGSPKQAAIYWRKAVAASPTSMGGIRAASQLLPNKEN